MGLHISIRPRKYQTRDVVGGISNRDPTCQARLQKQAILHNSIRSVETFSFLSTLFPALPSATQKKKKAKPPRAVSAAENTCMLVSNHAAEVQERDGLRITMETHAKAQHRMVGDSALLSKIPSSRVAEALFPIGLRLIFPVDQLRELILAKLVDPPAWEHDRISGTIAEQDKRETIERHCEIGDLWYSATLLSNRRHFQCD